MPEPNLLPLNLHELNVIPSDYQIRIPVLPEAKRSLLMDKYQMSLETAMQIVVNLFTNYLIFDFVFISVIVFIYR